MDNILDRISTVVRESLTGDGTVNFCLASNICEGEPCACCMNVAKDILSELNLSVEQARALASGEMVAVKASTLQAANAGFGP